jgi:hypothetical protein
VGDDGKGTSGLNRHQFSSERHSRLGLVLKYQQM